MYQEINAFQPEVDFSKILNHGNKKLQKIIYVCTFCQVFSTEATAISQHINSSHSVLLPVGTTAENFVSKLNALPNEIKKSSSRKTGRPKKDCRISINTVVKEQDAKETPLTPRSDGFFWCEKCHRCFKKGRQLVKHVCFEADEDIFEEKTINSDATQEFRAHVLIDPEPWSRRSKYKDGTNHSESLRLLSGDRGCETQKEAERIPVNWRVDPSYVPLFTSEEEKLKFEKHLKSIDYSFVDVLFYKKDLKVKKGSNYGGSVYFCKKCKKTQKSLSHIRTHCLIHTDLKPFTCPKCPFETNAKGNLYAHMRKHNGNMFHCSHCNYQSNTRAHLLDHEATHSTVPHICQLCKNTYKTVRSLISHVKKYHNTSSGKKYLKTFLPVKSKNTIIHCSICQKKFNTASSFENHSRTFHLSNVKQTKNSEDNITQNISGQAVNNTVFQECSNICNPNKNLNCEIVSKDCLAELSLTDFFENQSGPIIFNGSYDQSELKKMFAATVSLNTLESELISAQLTSLNDSNQFNAVQNSSFEACDKTLAILDECLRNPGFEKQCLDLTFPESSISDACESDYQLSNVQPLISKESILQSEEMDLNPRVATTQSQLHEKFSHKKTEENKAAEIKLFEKCRRAPAYVCCVCSSIFICSSTLKDHLKDHVYNSSNVLIVQEFNNSTKDSDACPRISDVCPDLIEPSNSYSTDEKELEKLYSSSMDMIWYLPEVSVVLENDPALFDSVLDDITSFSMGDKFDEQEELNPKIQEMFCNALRSST